MPIHFKKFSRSIVPRLLLTVGATLLVSLSVWAYLDLHHPPGRHPTDILVRAATIFLFTIGIIFIWVLYFVQRPIRHLIDGTRLIAEGKYTALLATDHDDEMGQLAAAINRMGKEIDKKQLELNRQRNEYQTLFELVPCIITVQDRDYRLIKYNREFADNFAPNPGDYCYSAYKGRNAKCVVCPVEKTFANGKSHYSEETGFNKDGTPAHWIVNTSPIKNDKGEIVSVIEMNLDITQRKQLEERLEKSEKKYYAIFNNIPNPVFVLDKDTLDILDCNQSVTTVYGYAKEDVVTTPFPALFREDDKDRVIQAIKSSAVINQAQHVHMDGSTLFVDIWVSPSEYPGQKIFLVTTSDITKRIETEQQLSHAGKMATLGQMATGVAHELNQPLTVIKTLSSFFMKVLQETEFKKKEQFYDIAQKINHNVDRASKIINHMRQFARKSETRLEPVQVNEILGKAIEMFSQQLRVRGIDVIWDIEPELPVILADPDRLEQVFVNLLLNARDAIEQGLRTPTRHSTRPKAITLKTRSEAKQVIVEVQDTGIGIEDAIAGKIFEPFFTTKEVGEGTGLGLSISYGIVKDFGGDIGVTRQERGACFRMTFPLQGKHD